MPVARRSTTIKVLAALNLAVGSIGLFNGLLALFHVVRGTTFAGFVPPPGGGPGLPSYTLQDLESHFESAVPGFRAYLVGIVVGGLLLSIWLVVSGVGLLKSQKWGRTSAITWGWIDIVARLASAAIYAFLIVPAAASFFDNVLPPPPPGMPNVFRAVMVGALYLTAGLEVVLAVYPIVLLSILLSKSGKAAFEPLPPEEKYDDDADDDDDDDDRRGRFGDRDRQDRPKRDDDRYGERDDRRERY